MLRVLISVFVAAGCLLPQSRPAFRGVVSDSSGAVIPGAAVTVSAADKHTVTVTADSFGAWSLPSLAPGTYTVRVTAPGFGEFAREGVRITAGQTVTLDITLTPAMEKQQVTVEDQTAAGVTTDPAGNISAVVLGKQELDALSDDPDELSKELQALAGPGAGPNGGQIFIDGFTGTRLPPKSSIREVRINQNPFSSEYDRLGFGRIEIFTKPGTNKFHGEAAFNLCDGIWNARNPFSPNRLPYQERLYNVNLSGPLSRRASLFFDFERRGIDDNALVNATILDSAFRPAGFTESLATPSHRTSLSPRLDYLLSTNHTLVLRYRYTGFGQDGAGTGGLSLASRAYNTSTTEHQVQVTETAVLGTRAINETRFQFIRTTADETAADTSPAIDVLGSFSAGGSPLGRATNRQDRYEMQNYTTILAGLSNTKFGVRVRGIRETDNSPRNFAGTFTFSGLDNYRNALLNDGGPSQFSILTGTPLASVAQVDAGLFVQEELRLRPDLNLSLGLRYELQSNLGDWKNFAPRIGLAWAPWGSRQKRRTVLRAGFGIFYDRFAEALTLQARRLNGVTQTQYVIDNPGFFPTVPPLTALTGGRSAQVIRQVDSRLRAPYVMQVAAGVEHQLPLHTMFGSTFTWSHGERLLLSRNINAPIPGIGLRPYPGGEIFQYESAGILRGASLMTSAASHLGKRLALFFMYGLGEVNTNTDGPNSFPLNQYDLAAEYGLASYNQTHHWEAGGSIQGPCGIRFSPLTVGRSGLPFNITTGRDTNGDTLFNDRPSVVTAGGIPTKYGLLSPEPGAVTLGRNRGTSPAYFITNLRISKTFEFGGGGGKAAAQPGASGPAGTNSNFQSVFGDKGSERRFGLTAAIAAHNLLNSVNPDIPVAVLASPLFLRPIALAYNWGPSSATSNRRIELQLRFSF